MSVGSLSGGGTTGSWSGRQLSERDGSETCDDSGDRGDGRGSGQRGRDGPLADVWTQRTGSKSGT